MKSHVAKRIYWTLFALALLGIFVFISGPRLLRDGRESVYQQRGNDRNDNTTSAEDHAKRKDKRKSRSLSTAETLNLDEHKSILESALRRWEVENHRVLRSSEDADGNQSIVIAVPAPPEDYVSDSLDSALLGVPLETKPSARETLLKETADYTGFTSSTYAEDYWNLAGKKAAWRIIYIKLFNEKGVLTVSFTDTANSPDQFWREGMERAAMTEIESHGRLTPGEAANRFNHLFSIEGLADMRAAEGSPERARELKQ